MRGILSVRRKGSTNADFRQSYVDLLKFRDSEARNNFRQTWSENKFDNQTSRSWRPLYSSALVTTPNHTDCFSCRCRPNIQTDLSRPVFEYNEYSRHCNLLHSFLYQFSRNCMQFSSVVDFFHSKSKLVAKRPKRLQSLRFLWFVTNEKVIKKGIYMCMHTYLSKRW